MPDKRHKNVNWTLPTSDSGAIETWQAVEIAVLMDIRDELQTLNRLLGCSNFTRIPQVLRRISSNTANLPKVKRARA